MSNPLSALVARAAGRVDGWFNTWTGLGTDRDKTRAGEFGSDLRISDPELTDLYKGDGIARKVVNVVPRETWRQGFTLESADVDTLRKIRHDVKRLNAQAVFLEAHIWARLYGGAVVFVGANDSQNADSPLLEANVRSVSFLQVYDRRYAIPETWYKDPKHPKFATPETYRLTSLQGTSAVVHESRLVIFRGAHTDPLTRKVQLGWDSSVLQSAYDAIRAFWGNNKAVEHLVTDASQGVFKIRGLISQIAAGDLKNLQTRAVLMDQSRSIARSIMVDADSGEEFTKIQTSFSGIGDVLDRSANLVAAVTEIPVTLLMGQAPAGLNATGDVDLRTFYDRIKSDQENEAKPRLERLIQLLRLTRREPGKPLPGEVEVKFPSLWQETPKERADREKAEAEKDAILISNEIASPEEISPKWGFKPATSVNMGPDEVPGGNESLPKPTVEKDT